VLLLLAAGASKPSITAPGWKQDLGTGPAATGRGDIPPLLAFGSSRACCSATLTVLAVSSCCLSSLQGVGLLSQLRELYAARNQLNDLAPLQGTQLLGCKT